jgi:hypothetical protein
MARSRKTRKRRNKSSGSVGNILAIAGAICALVVLIGAGAYLALNTEQEISLNADLCPKTGARGTVAILLDTTDELAQVTKTEVKSRILETQNSLDRFYRVSVYSLSETGLATKPLVSICNPGRLDQMDSLAQQGLTANPTMIAQKYKEFERVITATVDNVFSKKFEAEQSPLLSSLQELYGILPKPVHVDSKIYPAGENQIIFVTDLLEHTDVFSIYKSGIDLRAYDESRAKEKYGRAYDDVSLVFWTVGRNKKGFSTMELMNFWAKVFVKDFNSSPKFHRLPGEI